MQETIHVEVTQADIDAANEVRKNRVTFDLCGKCPIARAATRATNRTVRVGEETLHAERGMGYDIWYLSDEARRWRQAWDAEDAVLPFSFDAQSE